MWHGQSMTTDDYSMDRPRKADSPAMVRRIAWVALAALAIVAFIVVDRYWLRRADGLDLAEVTTAQVRRGTLSIEVQGVGALAPASERWIASRVGGVVEDVFARPGQEVAAGAELVGLVNPQLRQAAVQARLSLAETQADHRRQLATFTDRRLAGEARVLDARATHEERRLRLEAETELREKKAVSEIDYRRTQIRAEQAEANLAFERQRLAELKEALVAETAASEARVAARQASLEEAERQVDALAVVATVAGTLRDVLVAPGQRIAAGAQVARVVDTRSLRGVIRVPETYASRLSPGQTALVTVLNADVPGVVARVDPAVTQGSVAIDVDLAGELPTGARPELSIRATVAVAELEDTLFVRRPAHVKDDSTADLFRLADDRRSAARTAVRFGLGTLRHVEVLAGLAEGDTVLLGNMTRFEDLETIAIR